MEILTAVYWPRGSTQAQMTPNIIHTEGNNPEGKMLTKSKRTTETTANASIKCKTTGKTKVDGK